MPADLTIEVPAPVVNHAMAHNELTLLHRLTVAASGDLADVIITVRVVAALGRHQSALATRGRAG